MIYVNKMDIMGADFYNVLNMIHDRLKCNAVPIQLPIGAEDTFRGIIDLVEMKADVYYDDLGKDMRVEEIPADMMELAQEYRTKLIDACADIDDEIMMLALEEEEIPTDMIRKALRRGTIDNLLVPVVCGTSYRNKGVQKLLDAIVDFMPSPLDIPAIKGVDPETEEEDERPADDNAPFSALAFKIMTDPYVGRLSFIRVYSGKLTTGSTVLNSTKKQKERIGRILQMHANHREDIEEVFSGDIAAVVGLKNTTTGDTLCVDDHPIILESMEFPEPVIRVAIEPKTKAGQEKMGIALAKLAEEDPTFKTYTDEETGQTIIAGMGELHLEITRWRPTWALPRSPTRRPSRRAWSRTPSMPVSPAVRASTATSASLWSPTSLARAMSSSMRSPAVSFPRSISPLLTLVSRVPCRPVFWPATPWLT